MSKMVVAFATTGRADVLRKTVALLEKQTRKPDRILISAVQEDDYAGLAEGSVPLDAFTGARGLCQQRNLILDRLDGDELLVFFDDDFLPADTYLAAVEAAFERNPELSLATGTVLHDGIRGPGFDFDTGLSLLETAPETSDAPREKPVFNVYGCNFALRMSHAREQGAKFDEELPLYCWLEDVDFSRQLASRGLIKRLGDAQGVHLGIKKGRTSGVKLGYSQIVNPLYLVRKGTCSQSLALNLMCRNMGSNLVRSLRPEPFIDRVGRLRGNFVGLRDILRGIRRPSRALDL